jgi:outer membrane protein assembly complex protein YaeT
MIRRTVLLICLLWAVPQLFPQALPRLRIRKVLVQGNLRIPTDTILHYVSAVPDAVYDENKIRGDLRPLYDLGFFQRLDIETEEAGEGRVDVIYRVHELPFISEFVMEGLSQAQQDQVQHLLEKEKLMVRTETPFRPGTVNKTANFVHTWLQMHKYPFSEVRVIEEEERPGTIRVRLSIHAGPRLDVGEISFDGNRQVAARDLLKQMQYTRPVPYLTPWVNRGAYQPENLAADLESLRRHYQSRGFAAAHIGTPQVTARDFPRRWWMFLPKFGGTKQKLALRIPVTEGPTYQLISVVTQGSGKAAGAQVAEIVSGIKYPNTYDYLLLDGKRQKIVDALGHFGYGLAQVELEQSVNDDARTVSASYKIHAGDPVAIGKIRFEGNERLREKFLRREVIAREGEVFDSAKLDESIKRLNRSGMIKEVQRADVALEMNDKTESLDIIFKVKEKDRQGIYGTGGTGGVGGGYLGILYTAFDLLGLGESLSLQIDGGASQSNMLLNIIGSRFLGLPFNLGLSVFHRLTNYNVASLVPDASDLIHVLRHRSTGMGLGGAYPVTSRIQVGIGTQFEHRTISEQDPLTGGILQTSEQNRIELSPTFAWDATQGTGPGMRGARFAFVNAWSGATNPWSVDSVAQSVRLSEHVGDPFTKGRNSFAAGFQTAVIRPRNGVPLTSDRRFYPGDEVMRGFPRGGLTPWAYPSGTETSPSPLGADTVLAFSFEYRIPIQGPLSAAAFVDLGWSKISKKNLDASSAASLIEETNGLLRGSLGGELRLQLPIIRQPGRLIFSWNFLRLSALIQGKNGLLRLADPRTTLHFALGDRF